MCGRTTLLLFGVLVPLLGDVTVAHHSRGRYQNVIIVVNPAKLASFQKTITIPVANHLVPNVMLEKIFCTTEVNHQDLPILYENSFNGLMSQHLLIESNLTEIKPYAFNNTILSGLTLRINLLEEIRGHFFFNVSVNSLDMGFNNIKYIEAGAFREIARPDQVDPFKDNLCADTNKDPSEDWKYNWKYVRGLKSNNFIDLQGNELETVPSGVFVNLNVEYLIISENLIRVLEPNSFSECTALKTLVLRSNQLRTIENNVFKCGTLVNLDLNSNIIEIIAPGAFEGLSAIRNIDLGLNKLKELKKGVFKISLKTLILEENEMASIEQGAFDGLKVEELRLSYNSLGHIGEGVFSNFSVISLFLGSNSITSIEPRAFADLPELLFLCLKNNKLTQVDKNMFHNVPNLQRIYLTGNDILFISQTAFEGLPVFINDSLSQ